MGFLYAHSPVKFPELRFAPQLLKIPIAGGRADLTSVRLLIVLQQFTDRILRRFPFGRGSSPCQPNEVFA